MEDLDLSPIFEQFPIAVDKRMEIVNETALQVQKDFNFHRLEIETSGNPEEAYTELYQQVRPIIGELMDRDPMLFLRLLKTIDISEKQYRTAMQNYDSLHQFTHLILKRELQKVVIRTYYRSH